MYVCICMCVDDMLQLLPELPTTISRLYNEQRCGRVSACVLPQLIELLHCLMFMHPGFPELYRPVVSAINVRFSFLMISAEWFKCLHPFKATLSSQFPTEMSKCLL